MSRKAALDVSEVVPVAGRYWQEVRSLYPLRYLLSYAVPIRHRKPIFVIGCPRSGTTLLAEIFASSPHLGALPGEGHSIWQRFHPLRAKNWASDALDEHDVTDAERAYIYRRFYRIAGGRRFVEKTPRNCLRIPYLRALFPDAYFIYLRRDGRDTINSLIREWRSPSQRPRLGLPVPLRIGGYEGKGWKFILPPGWQQYADRPLAEVCAFQWVAANQAVLDAKPAVPARQWTEVTYEEVVGTPVETARRLFEWAEVPFGREVRAFCDARVDNRSGKWRREHSDEIAGVLPMIAPMMHTLGYAPG